MRKFLRWGIFSLCLLCFGCSTGHQEVIEEGRYKISLPGSLKAVDNLDEKASLQYADFGKELYFTLNQTPKTEVLNNLGAAKVTSEGVPDLETYSKFISSTFKYTVSANEINLKQRGKQYWLEFEGETPKARLYYQIAYAEDEEYFYQLICWTLAERKALHKEVIESCLESFEVI